MARRHRRNPPKPRYHVTYDVVTEESAADGDVAESGWVAPGGYHVTDKPEPVEWDPRFDDEDPVEWMVKTLRDAGATNPSASFFHTDLWYETEGVQDFRTGDYERQAYHPEGFTVEQQKRIFAAITRPRRASPVGGAGVYHNPRRRRRSKRPRRC